MKIFSMLNLFLHYTHSYELGKGKGHVKDHPLPLYQVVFYTTDYCYLNSMTNVAKSHL
jgi:hypothetical protein